MIKISSFLLFFVCVAFSASVCDAYDNGAPHSRLPALGWSSWVALGPEAEHPIFDFCDETSVKAAIDAFVSDDLGLFDAGYRHFHLDDCWAGGRNSSGYLFPEKKNWPNGMKPVIDYAHSKGVVFGLYTCAGTLTCVGRRPGSKDHWKEDAALWAEWGVDWVKMDWCNTEGMLPKTTYPLMSAALNATGRSIHFNMCEWGVDNPWEWGDAIAQSWRSTDDHTGVWSSTKSIINQTALVPAKYSGRPYGWNDMDMLETGNYAQAAHANGRESNMTAEEYKTEFSMWAIAASPLVVTTPIMKCSSSHSDVGKVTCTPTITPLQREILLNKEVIAINQDVTPQGRPVTTGELKYWARVLSDGDVALAMYNEDDDMNTFSFAFSTLVSGGIAPGWDGDIVVSVRDLWKHEELGQFRSSTPTLGIPGHSTRLFRLSKK